MSWLFSQALAEEFSAGTSLAGQQFAQLNVMPTPHKFWRSDKTIESSDHSRFGLTSQLLTEGHGEELLTAFLADSHARISAQQEKEQVSRGSEVGFGTTCAASFAKYDQSESLWKTAQRSLLGDSEKFSETWPRWGSMRNGESFLRPIPALPICESASGLWPTMTVHGNYNQPGMSKNSGMGLASAVKLWQTPVADDAVERKRGKYNSRGEPKLSAQVKLIPTPTAMNFTGGAAMCKWGGAGARAKMKTMFSSEEINGQLNPEWVEWLMGWCIGWTDLKPLAMDKFHEWRQQHGNF
jgi:hypothetical protein